MYELINIPLFGYFTAVRILAKSLVPTIFTGQFFLSPLVEHMARKGDPSVRPGRATRSNKTAGTESIDAESKDNAKNQPKPSPKAQFKPSPKPAPQRAEKGISKSSGKPKLNQTSTAWYNTGNKGAGVAGVLCGKQLAESSDREIWKQALAALVGICHRNSFGDEELTREVGTALHQARGAASQ